jgi:hypothetical protein
MNEHNITLLRQIIARRKEMYIFFVERFGKNYALTMDILQSIEHLSHLLSMIEGRCGV